MGRPNQSECRFCGLTVVGFTFVGRRTVTDVRQAQIEQGVQLEPEQEERTGGGVVGPPKVGPSGQSGAMRIRSWLRGLGTE